MTIDGPDPNKECKIPFKFTNDRRYPKFIQHNECALDHTGRPWCPTKLDGNGRFSTSLVENNDWGYCGYDCVLTDLPAGDIQTLFDYHVQIRNIIIID